MGHNQTSVNSSLLSWIAGSRADQRKDSKLNALGVTAKYWRQSTLASAQSDQSYTSFHTIPCAFAPMQSLGMVLQPVILALTAHMPTKTNTDR
jgi:hypothetical protein